MVLSVEAKRRGPESWEAYTDNGREPTGRLVLDWVKEAVERGAGEILLTSVDQEGTRKGYDVELVSAVTAAVSVPVIASGGMGTIAHVLDVVQRGKADAVAVADVLHYDRMSVVGIRDEISKAGIPTRKICQL
jgi:cyclase